MQVSVETTSAIERRMTIGLPASQVDSEVEKRLQKTAKTVRMNGFRPGKVPLSVVRRRYGEGVRQEVVGEVMRDAYMEALQKEELTPAGYPRFEPKNLEQGSDLEFVVIFEVYPEIELADLSSLELTKQSTEVTDADIDNMVDMLRNQAAKWVEKEEAAAQGDRLNVAYKGTVDGEAFEGGSADDANIEIGSNRMIPGFEDGLVGAKAGETRTLDLQFPEDYHAENLKGKAAQFEVTVKKVEAKELPEVDEELFAQYGVSEGGLEGFRAELQKNMEREANFALANKVKQQIVDKLIAQNEFEVPSALIANEITKIKEDAVQRFGGQMKADQLPDELFKDQAEKRVKTGLIFAHIIKAQELKATDEEIKEKVTELSASYQEPEQVVNWYMNNPEQKAQIESVVLEDTVITYITSQAKVTEEKVAYEDAVKPQEAPAAQADEEGEAAAE